MNLAAYHNSIWLADAELFQRHIQAAMVRPCPTAEQLRAQHREWMQLAKDLPGMALQATGKDCRIEAELARGTSYRIESIPQHVLEGPAPTIRAEAPRAIRAVKGKVGVIPIYGPVDQRMSEELAKAGGTPLDFVSAALDSLMGNASIGAVVLRMDSPGGAVNGVQELADKIYSARANKPIYAIADSLAASAGLWIASAATMFISTPAGGAATVGSVGVLVMHVDESAMNEKLGVKVTTVSSGKYKTEFSPHEPMSEDARAHAQSRVDAVHEQFMAALKRNRDTTIENVRQNYGQGRVLTAQQALSVGMIDRILSYEELIAKLTGGAENVPARGVQADATRLRWEAKKRAMEVA